MPAPQRPIDKQLGNPEPGRAHWPLDLELHPGEETKLPEGPPPSADEEDDED